MPNGSVLILTDETQFATALSGSWQGQQKIPDITVLNSNLWRNYDAAAHDLIVVGPISGGKLYSLLDSLEHDHVVILCLPLDSYNDLRARYPRFLHICLREDWAQTVLLVANETMRRLEAMKAAKRAEREAARNQNLATLGRYMSDMKHSMNNALTSMLGNAELLLLEPGQLSSQSLGQIKTMHSMAMRINEIMVRFSSLTNEMRDAEIVSQAETSASVDPATVKR